MDSILEKLGVYELFSIFFAGSVITYCSIKISEIYFNFSFEYYSNGINMTYLFVLTSCFVGFLFQELGSLVIKRILFRKNKLLYQAYSSDKDSSYHLSPSEHTKLEKMFKKDNICDLNEKYNKCKFYIMEKGSTSKIDKDMALSSMSRSFFVYFFVVSLTLLIKIIYGSEYELLIPSGISILISVVMYFRFKRFAIMRYVYIFRNYLYKNSSL